MNLSFFSEIVDILSEKCKMEKEEVKEKYETFQKNYPEGEITKEEFLETRTVSHPWYLTKILKIWTLNKCFI